jgi:immune inhibitor A
MSKTLFCAALLAFFCAPAPAAAGPAAPPCEVKQTLVILVQFPDVKHTVDRGEIVKKFFRDLDGYVREMSYGKACVAGRVTEKWYTLPHPISHYKVVSQNLLVKKKPIDALLNDVVNAADKDVDFSKYSYISIYMGATQPQYGMMCLYAYPGFFAWTATEKLKTKSGQEINADIAIFTSQAHLGNIAHDMIHAFGGIRGGKRVVPCLYDHDLQSKPGQFRQVFLKALINMGFWDPMSCHCYKQFLPPMGISSWTKMRLGWIDRSKILTVKPDAAAEVILGPLEDGNARTLVVRIPISSATYYLLENRQPTGYDRYLPGKGVLIMYADDTVPECLDGKAPVRLMNADPEVSLLRGAAFDVGGKDTFIDEKNGLKIQLLEKVGESYRIRVSPYAKPH